MTRMSSLKPRPIDASIILPVKDQVRQLTFSLKSQNLLPGEIASATKAWLAAHKHRLSEAVGLEDFALVNQPTESLVEAEYASPALLHESFELIEKNREVEKEQVEEAGWFDVEAVIIEMTHVPSAHALGKLARNGEGLHHSKGTTARACTSTDHARANTDDQQIGTVANDVHEPVRPVLRRVRAMPDESPSPPLTNTAEPKGLNCCQQPLSRTLLTEDGAFEHPLVHRRGSSTLLATKYPLVHEMLRNTAGVYLPLPQNSRVVLPPSHYDSAPNTLAIAGSPVEIGPSTVERIPQQSDTSLTSENRQRKLFLEIMKMLDDTLF